MIKNNKLFYIIFIIMISAAMMVRFYFDDFVYYYLRVTNGTQFDTPLEKYKLNDGFYFVGNKTERGTISVRYKDFPDIPIVVGIGMPIDLPLGVQKGFFYVYSQSSGCVLYRRMDNPRDIFATIEDIFLINSELDDVEGFDLSILCHVISYKK